VAPAKLRVAVIGAGFIGRDHLAAYRHRPDVELVGVADSSMATAEAAATEVGARAYADHRSMLAAEHPDAVSICVPTALHLPVTEDVAAAGAHVLLEKPMAASVAECDAIGAACERAGIALMVGFTHRFHRELIEAKRLISEGAIGPPSLAQDLFSFGENAPWPGWYYERSLSGGGELMHDAVHLVDRLSWLIDSPIVEVFGRTTSYARDIDGVEDGGVAVLRFASGAVASLFVNQSTYPLRADAPSVPMPGRCELEIHGPRGSIRYRTWHELIVDLAGQPSRTVSGVKRDEMRREIDEFLGAIREHRAPSVGWQEGRRGIAVVQAIYRSNAAGRPVSVDEPEGHQPSNEASASV
jgi:predicted dehydrogenase